MQQIKFDNACTNEFQMISVGGSFVLLTLMSIFLDRDKLKNVLAHGTLYGLCAGLFNGAKNLISLVVFLFIPMFTASPMKIGAGITLTFVVSRGFFKEKIFRVSNHRRYQRNGGYTAFVHMIAFHPLVVLITFI